MQFFPGMLQGRVAYGRHSEFHGMSIGRVASAQVHGAKRDAVRMEVRMDVVSLTVGRRSPSLLLLFKRSHGSNFVCIGLFWNPRSGEVRHRQGIEDCI